MQHLHNSSKIHYDFLHELVPMKKCRSPHVSVFELQTALTMANI